MLLGNPLNSLQQANLQEISYSPDGTTGTFNRLCKPNTKKGSVLGGGQQETQICSKLLMILELLSRRTQLRFWCTCIPCLSAQPNSFWTTSEAGKYNTRLQSRSRSWGSDPGRGWVPPFATTSPAWPRAKLLKVTVPHLQSWDKGWQQQDCSIGGLGRRVDPRRHHGLCGPGESFSTFQRMVLRVTVCKEKQVHVCTAAKVQMGNFCTFAVQYLGHHKSKKVVVH